MFKVINRILVCGLLCLPLIGTELKAQESGIIQVTATVAAALTVTGTNNLIFQTVTPGVDKSVDKSTPGEAGEWTVSGANGSEVTLEFTLPTELISGVNTMPISFTATDASYSNNGANNQGNPTAEINPAIVTTTTLRADGDTMAWIGGTVNPAIAQTSGDYSADIVLIVTLTGN